MSDKDLNAAAAEQPIYESNSPEDNITSEKGDLRFHLEDSMGGDQPLAETEIIDNQDKILVVQQELEEWKDKYIRLASEFDNFRKRTLKEKSELVKYANEDLLKSLLPVLDDFDRSQLVFEKSDNLSAIQDGVKLIHHKFKNILSAKGIKPMESMNVAFDSEHHEAITSVPASDETQKGKVIDEIEKGYYLDEKVIRFAKVIVGA